MEKRYREVKTMDELMQKLRAQLEERRSVFLDNNWRTLPQAPEYMRNDAGQLIRVVDIEPNEKRGQ